MKLDETTRLALQDKMIAGIRAIGLDLPLQKTELLIRYLELLAKWNETYNLTAVRDPQEMLYRHLIDSLSIHSHVEGQRILDVGTGPGLPGIPLAILFSEKHVILLDTNSKKTRFLTQCKIELGLQNIEIINARVEKAKIEPRVDQIVSRAFTALGNMIDLCAAHLSSDGSFLAMKGNEPLVEYEQIPDSWKIASAVQLSVPGCTGQRHLIIIKRTER